MLVLVLGSRALAHAGILSDSIDAIGDSITRGFDANSCTYGDQVDRNWATGDNHGTSYCSSGSDSTFSHAERLECAKPGEIINLNDAESGATMRGDFAAQSTTARANLIAQPAPRYVDRVHGSQRRVHATPRTRPATAAAATRIPTTTAAPPRPRSSASSARAWIS